MRVMVPEGSRAQQADDVLCLRQIGRGDLIRLIGTSAQDAVDLADIGHQAVHLGADRRQLVHRQIDQIALEGAELLTGEPAERFLPGNSGQR
jgi:hypothetical protein